MNEKFKIQLSLHDVEVREFHREDLPDTVKYFFESSPAFLASIGLKTPEPGAAEKFREMMEQRLVEREKGGPPLTFLTVLYQGKRVGCHPTTHREPGRSLILHAHFFQEKFRGKGIGTVSYVLAVEKFLVEYGYQEVLFKTPLQNAAPMKIKEKLGLKPIGEEIIDWPELAQPLQAKVFRVTLQQLPDLKSRVGLSNT